MTMISVDGYYIELLRRKLGMTDLEMGELIGIVQKIANDAIKAEVQK